MLPFSFIMDCIIRLLLGMGWTSFSLRLSNKSLAGVHCSLGRPDGGSQWEEKIQVWRTRRSIETKGGVPGPIWWQWDVGIWTSPTAKCSMYLEEQWVRKQKPSEVAVRQWKHFLDSFGSNRVSQGVYVLLGHKPKLDQHWWVCQG